MIRRAFRMKGIRIGVVKMKGNEGRICENERR